MFKKIMCLAMASIMAVGMSACGQKEKTANSNGSDDGEKVITVSTIRADSFLDSAVEKYKEIHPEITIEVKSYAAANGDMMISKGSETGAGSGKAGGKTTQRILNGNENPEDIEKYVNTLNTEIMTGKGPDIVSVDELPYKKYADKNLLADLSKLMESDKSFDVSQYYSNILDALKYKDSIFALPLKYSLTLLNGDSRIMNAPTTGLDDSKWTWEDLVENY